MSGAFAHQDGIAVPESPHDDAKSARAQAVVVLASVSPYRFFHPPRCPGAPPVERGVGPNSGPDWRESVGWKILLPVLGPGSSGEGLRDARPGR
jgi:hypothetical protein